MPAKCEGACVVNYNEVTKAFDLGEFDEYFMLEFNDERHSASVDVVARMSDGGVVNSVEIWHDDEYKQGMNDPAFLSAFTRLIDALGNHAL